MLLDKEKDFSQVVQSNSFCPEWVNMCFFRPEDREKVWLHCTHSYGFTPLCVLLCLVTFFNVVKSLPHCSQVRSILDGGWGRTGGLGRGFRSCEGHSCQAMLVDKSESHGNVWVKEKLLCLMHFQCDNFKCVNFASLLRVCSKSILLIAFAR